MNYAHNAPKRPTNLSLNEELVRAAKSLDLNVSAIAEEALAKAVRRQAARLWLEENAEAIEAYNERVRKAGVFSDKIRRF